MRDQVVGYSDGEEGRLETLEWKTGRRSRTHNDHVTEFGGVDRPLYMR